MCDKDQVCSIQCFGWKGSFLRNQPWRAGTVTDEDDHNQTVNSKPSNDGNSDNHTVKTPTKRIGNSCTPVKFSVSNLNI